MKVTLSFFFLLLLVVGCNKERRYSKKLIKGESWKVENITVDGTALSGASGTWTVSGDDIYKTVSQVSWQKDATNTTAFEWQFQDKGQAWVLNYLQDCDECEGPMLDELDYTAHLLSGSYEVVKHKNKEMIFKSSETTGYSGQLVEIKIVR
ncbi:MAG: hypothetical protein ACO1O6_04555 [Bacteroidota bacterium]